LAFEVLKYVCTYTCRGITLNLGTLQKTVYLVVDIFAVLVTVVFGLVHKPSTFSPMANLFPGFSSLQQVQLHSGRNCLNLFQTTAGADPVVPRLPKDLQKYGIFKICISMSSIHPKLSKIKNYEKIHENSPKK
jgi:hypothetical protein